LDLPRLIAAKPAELLLHGLYSPNESTGEIWGKMRGSGFTERVSGGVWLHFITHLDISGRDAAGIWTALFPPQFRLFIEFATRVPIVSSA
jgi:hypothetical protein